MYRGCGIWNKITKKEESEDQAVDSVVVFVVVWGAICSWFKPANNEVVLES